MTQQEFDTTGFYKGIMAKYDGQEWLIRQVNFKERLLGLWPPFADLSDDLEIEWVRCENVKKIIHAPKIEI